MVKASEDANPASTDEVDDGDVENFEFDEDGNLIDSAPIRSIGGPEEDKLARPIYCERFPKVNSNFLCIYYKCIIICRRSAHIGGLSSQTLQIPPLLPLQSKWLTLLIAKLSLYSSPLHLVQDKLP